MRTYKYTALSIALSGFIGLASFSQGVKNELMLNPGYFNDNNQLQYLKVNAKTKIDGKFRQVPDVAVSFYITDDMPAHLLGKAITNEKGEAVVFIPPSAREEWMKSAKPGFMVVSSASQLYDAAKATLDVTKARIKLDTGADRKITAVLTELKDSSWQPIKGVDIKVAVKRMGGDLNVSEAPTYTTDSLGSISADFKRDSLPGDSKGNLILIAKVEDNDTYGNLTTEKTVPWGTAFKYASEFNRRTLFARRGHSPLWLEWMAYTIIAAVWGVLLYLTGQIRKLKKLGV